MLRRIRDRRELEDKSMTIQMRLLEYPGILGLRNFDFFQFKAKILNQVSSSTNKKSIRLYMCYEGIPG